MNSSHAAASALTHAWISASGLSCANDRGDAWDSISSDFDVVSLRRLSSSFISQNGKARCRAGNSPPIGGGSRLVSGGTDALKMTFNSDSTIKARAYAPEDSHIPLFLKTRIFCFSSDSCNFCGFHAFYCVADLVKSQRRGSPQNRALCQGVNI